MIVLTQISQSTYLSLYFHHKSNYYLIFILKGQVPSISKLIFNIIQVGELNIQW